MSTTPRDVKLEFSIPKDRQQPKPVSNGKVESAVHVEIQHIQRIINGANKRLERLCEQIANK